MVARRSSVASSQALTYTRNHSLPLLCGLCYGPLTYVLFHSFSAMTLSLLLWFLLQTGPFFIVLPANCDFGGPTPVPWLVYVFLSALQIPHSLPFSLFFFFFFFFFFSSLKLRKIRNLKMYPGNIPLPISSCFLS